MPTIDTVVVGAGHAGLAVSRLLTDAGRDHVVLDRGRVAERWRSERWDSLHLLTPAWMTRLPGGGYTGPDPDRHLSSAELVRLLDRYAASFGAPVVERATVLSVERGDAAARRYRVDTTAGTWHARHVVVATGPHGTPYVPPGLAGVDVLPARDYRNPARLGPGGVLVVGASASGLQIADELNRAGRDVTLAVGRHTRVPRRYRGMDIFWWLAVTGRLARTIDEVPDPVAARREPSLQLVGRNDPDHAPDHAHDLDLAALSARGVRLAGRLESVTGRHARFGTNLAADVARADQALSRLLDSIDDLAHRAGLRDLLRPEPRPRPVEAPPAPRRLDLRAEGIDTVLVAAGYRPDHSWLRLPVLRPDGSIRQCRGATPAEGLYVVGQPFQHRRDSGYIDGARHDARAVVEHLLGHAVTRRPAGRTEPAA